MTLSRLLAPLLLCLMPILAQAQNGTLRIEITEGVVEPMPFAAPDFVAESAAAGEQRPSFGHGRCECLWRKSDCEIPRL